MWSIVSIQRKEMETLSMGVVYKDIGGVKESLEGVVGDYM